MGRILWRGWESAKLAVSLRIIQAVFLCHRHRANASVLLLSHFSCHQMREVEYAVTEIGMFPA